MPGGPLLRIVAYVVVFLVSAAIMGTVRSRSLRQIALLIASYALYFTWSPWFAAVLAASTTINYLVGEWLRRKPSGRALWSGIFFNFALLGVFKYLPETAVHLPFSALHPFARLVMPLGISFWTFQALSYLFDVYQGEDIDPSLWEFALYMAFFPVTISGPVCRMTEMLPQFRSTATTASDDVLLGLRRVATGVFMMQLARLLGQGILAGDGINSGFDRLTRWSGLDVWCLAFGYGLQLFFDFAGYSHIAIGAARALGFEVPENFSRPFASTTPSIFWTRWHMSLSFWIRDYVFFPIMQMRREIWWRNSALLVSMILFGLWHKASVLFLLWGVYHGVLLVLHRILEAQERKYDWPPIEAAGSSMLRAWNALAWVTTISLVSVGWILFRAHSVSQARQMFGALVDPTSYRVHFLTASLYVMVAAIAAAYVITLLTIDALNSASSHQPATSESPGFAVLLARSRWFWLAPLYAVALFFLLFVTISHGTSAAQMMYGNF
jgi:alginate O-acetyltransferase complex protein AlgI